MARKYEELVATILSERWRPRDQAPPTIAILTVVPEESESAGSGGGSSQQELSVKLRIEDDEDDALVQRHATLRFYGHWDSYKGERQFVAQTVVRATPHSRASVITYLKEAPCVGQILAKRLWDAFGSDAVKVLRKDPQAAAAAVKGLTEEAAAEASKWLQYHAAIESCRMAIEGLLAGHGFPKSTAKKAIKEWGNRAAQVVERNPFALWKFRGVGFKRCDALYLALGKSPTRLKRQALCAYYAIANPDRGDGSTWMYSATAEKAIVASIGGARVRCCAALDMAKRAGLVVSQRTDSNQTTLDWDGPLEWLADAGKAGCEMRLANYVVEALLEESL